MKRYIWMSVLVCCILLSSGCIKQPLEGEERERWVTIATPMAENTLESIKNNDYQGFIKDYSQEMIDATPPEAFADLKELLDSKIGTYISFEPERVIEEDGFVSVFFIVKFEKEEKVTMQLVYKKDDETHKLQGLWFNSPKLRE